MSLPPSSTTQMSLCCRSRVIVKLGGGCITHKATRCKANLKNIKNICRTVAEIIHHGYCVVLVHGAGSFGHIDARRYRLVEGYVPGANVDQDKGVSEVRGQMDRLNGIVCAEMRRACKKYAPECDIKVVSIPPRTFARNTGARFAGNLQQFAEGGCSTLAITFGDVVQCDSPKLFGILSGDDLMLRLSEELPGVTHVVFFMVEDGVLTVPGSEGKLIEVWNSSKSVGFRSSHNSKIDVTGGILYKIERAEMIANKVPHVWFLSGAFPDRLKALLMRNDVLGTRIMPQKFKLHKL